LQENTVPRILVLLPVLLVICSCAGPTPPPPAPKAAPPPTDPVAPAEAFEDGDDEKPPRKSEMAHEDYLKLGQYLWKTYVPKTGQADTMQGELLRAIEKLRDECLRNGNGNWDLGHEILAQYLLDTLTTSPDVPDAAKRQLKLDIERILDFEHPLTEDDVFNRVERTILDWYLYNQEPIPRAKNPKLHR
jgi:hypothetical protein